MKNIIFTLFPILIFAQFPKIKLDTLDLVTHPKIQKFELSKKINETSGLTIFKDTIYTFNDSGGENEIYQLSETGKILKTLKIPNSKNIDWEDMTSSNDCIYIADTGNNLGNRKDLKIYSFNPSTNSTEILHFNYKNQIDFPVNSNRKTDFDCESVIYYNGKLHLFSKEWTSNQTKHYILHLNKSNQVLEEIETFNVEMLATGVTIFNDNFYLVGYTRNGIVSLYQFEISNSSDLFFKKQPQKTYLGFSPTIGQIEAITSNSKGLYISGEEIKVSYFHSPAMLYFIPFESF